LSALQSIQEPRLQSGQYILQQIWCTARQLYNQGTIATLQWVPAHEGIVGNEMAHSCAQMATKRKAKLAGDEGPRLKSRALQIGREWIRAEKTRRFDQLQVGKFTRTIDKALPREHMTLVYNALHREEAKILSQLRTGHTPLNDNLARIGAEQSANCGCRMGVESVQHFLFYCPKWRNERTKLREAMADRWGDLAYALGGWSGRRDRRNSRFVDGPREKWKPNLKIIKATIQFVIKTKRFQPKATIAEYTEGIEARAIEDTRVLGEMVVSDNKSVGSSL